MRKWMTDMLASILFICRRLRNWAFSFQPSIVPVRIQTVAVSRSQTLCFNGCGSTQEQEHRWGCLWLPVRWLLASRFTPLCLAYCAGVVVLPCSWGQGESDFAREEFQGLPWVVLWTLSFSQCWSRVPGDLLQKQFSKPGHRSRIQSPNLCLPNFQEFSLFCPQNSVFILCLCIHECVYSVFGYECAHIGQKKSVRVSGNRLTDTCDRASMWVLVVKPGLALNGRATLF